MRPIELDVWTTTDDIRDNEYFQSCGSVESLEIALEACYESEEEAAEAAAEQRAQARDEGLSAMSQVVRLRVVLEKVERVGPNDFEL